MRRDLLSVRYLFVLATLALVVVAAFVPGRLALAVRVYALVLCALALGLALAALRRAYPRTTPLRPRRGRRGPRPRPGRLVRLEQLVALGAAGAFEFHYHVRPRLRTIAGGLLATRRRISLDGDPASARRVLGEETYELVRADRPPPEDRLGPGPTVSQLQRAVESLEAV